MLSTITNAIARFCRRRPSDSCVAHDWRVRLNVESVENRLVPSGMVMLRPPLFVAPATMYVAPTEQERVQELCSSNVALRNHSVELPHQNLEAPKTIQDSVAVGKVTHKPQVAGNDKAELYDYPGAFAQPFDGGDPGRLIALVRRSSPAPSAAQPIPPSALAHSTGAPVQPPIPPSPWIVPLS